MADVEPTQPPPTASEDVQVILNEEEESKVFLFPVFAVCPLPFP
jgi:hypothetical protein